MRNNVKDATRRRFFARMMIERDDALESGGWVTFDAITADSLRMFFKLQKPELLMLRVGFNKFQQRYPEYADTNEQWLTLEVSSDTNAEFLPAWVILFGDSEDIPVVSITRIEFNSRISEDVRLFDRFRVFIRKLQVEGSMIRAVLDHALRFSKQLSVAVYDVGQGNCNAIVDEYAHPRVFFDLGWPANFHKATCPTLKPDFFSCGYKNEAPVVLSHWDMDHWAFAIQQSRFQRSTLTSQYDWNLKALSRFWIARVPQSVPNFIGPMAMSFLFELYNSDHRFGIRSILLWPEGTEKIEFNSGWIEACSPGPNQKNDRNNNGLAMFVRPKSRRSSIVLTGDADFSSIPSFRKKRPPSISGIVAPHHGAKITSNYLPLPKNAATSKVIISVGGGNTYGHPKQDALDAYNYVGWNVQRTSDRSVCNVQHASHIHGNSLLKFSRHDNDPKCGCECVSHGYLCLHT